MGRLPYVQRRKYQIQHMWDKHHEIKRLLLLGLSQKKIAEIIGCTPQNICQITGSELFKREMQVAAAARDSAAVDVARAVKDMGPKALDLLDAVLENDVDRTGEHASLNLRTNVAQDILDRHAKTAKVRHIDGNIQHSHVVTEDAIARIKDRAKEIEAEFEVLEEAG